ncbi:MAG: hypothetical protein VKL59_04675 [Nostocaceae cyanobacterium]|nr:hypothetical protein [Nostocaceae cyanobacterium]
MYDHREIARVMDLFHFEEHSPGMIFWHPMGWRMFPHRDCRGTGSR